MATILPFPTARRVGKIRKTAVALDTGTPRSAKAYWSRSVDDLMRQMRRAGIDEDRIDDELIEFWRAVQAELARRNPGYGAPGGDVA